MCRLRGAILLCPVSPSSARVARFAWGYGCEASPMLLNFLQKTKKGQARRLSSMTRFVEFVDKPKKQFRAFRALRGSKTSLPYMGDRIVAPPQTTPCLCGSTRDFVVPAKCLKPQSEGKFSAAETAHAGELSAETAHECFHFSALEHFHHLAHLRKLFEERVDVGNLCSRALCDARAP